MDINKMTDTLEPEETGVGGLQLPGKDRVVLRPYERKSLLVHKIKAESTVIQVEAKRLTQKVKSVKKNDLLDMLVPRMLRRENVMKLSARIIWLLKECLGLKIGQMGTENSMIG
ncbi:hypothetical protein Tco_1407668 [Tanacetum coccineum]